MQAHPYKPDYRNWKQRPAISTCRYCGRPGGRKIRLVKLAATGPKTFALQKVNSTSIFFTGPKLAKWSFPGRRGKLALNASAAKDAGAIIYIFDFPVLFIFSGGETQKVQAAGIPSKIFFISFARGEAFVL